MNARRAPLALVAAAGLALAACAGTSAPHPSAAGGASGDDLLRAGDFDGAARAFEREGADSPVAREKLANARTRAAVSHAMAAMRAAGAGDVQRAQSELDRADAFGRDLPAVRDAHADVDARVAAAQRAASLRDEARSMLSTDPAGAERLLAEAQAAAPAAADAADSVAALRREATLRAEADRSAGRAALAWDARDRDGTVRELNGARFGGRPVAKADELRRRIEQDLLAESGAGDEPALRSAAEFASDAGLHASVARTLRERLADRLLVSARDLRDTRRPATAALLELEAKRLRGDAKTPALDEVREAATVTVLVRPFDDETGGRVDGMRLARALRERLALDALGGGLPLRALDDSDAARAAHPDALRLTGRVLSARESEGRVGRENRPVRYQTGTVRKPNPEFDALITKVDAAAAVVRRAQDEQRSAVAFYNSLRSTGFIHGDGTPRLGDVEIQTRLANAQARVDRADFALQRAKGAEFDLRQTAAATPREIEEPVWAEHLLTVTTSTKSSQITAHLDLAQGGESLLSQDVTAAAQHKETVALAFAPAGLAADPDETPDDATMAARAADRFAAMAAGRVRAAAETGARRHLVAARAAEAAGRRDEAAESYAMYLLSTPDVAAPERADAARALTELLGVHVALRTGPGREE